MRESVARSMTYDEILEALQPVFIIHTFPVDCCDSRNKDKPDPSVVECKVCGKTMFQRDIKEGESFLHAENCLVKKLTSK